MYVPMGGSAAKYWSAWFIFIFVAMWHDLNIEFLAFGLGNAVLITIGVFLDLGLKKLFKKHRD